MGVIHPVVDFVLAVVEHSLVGLRQARVAALRGKILGHFINTLVIHFLGFALPGEANTLLE